MNVINTIAHSAHSMVKTRIFWLFWFITTAVIATCVIVGKAGIDSNQTFIVPWIASSFAGFFYIKGGLANVWAGFIPDHSWLFYGYTFIVTLIQTLFIWKVLTVKKRDLFSVIVLTLFWAGVDASVSEAIQRYTQSLTENSLQLVYILLFKTLWLVASFFVLPDLVIKQTGFFPSLVIRSVKHLGKVLSTIVVFWGVQCAASIGIVLSTLLLLAIGVKVGEFFSAEPFMHYVMTILKIGASCCFIALNAFLLLLWATITTEFFQHYHGTNKELEK